MDDLNLMKSQEAGVVPRYVDNRAYGNNNSGSVIADSKTEQAGVPTMPRVTRMFAALIGPPSDNFASGPFGLE